MRVGPALHVPFHVADGGGRLCRERGLLLRKGSAHERGLLVVACMSIITEGGDCGADDKAESMGVVFGEHICFGGRVLRRRGERVRRRRKVRVADLRFRGVAVYEIVVYFCTGTLYFASTNHGPAPAQNANGPLCPRPHSLGSSCAT